MNKHFDVIVIGSGPSGMTAAARIASLGKSVAVLERNEEFSKKIFATGNGRCNFSNENALDAKRVIDYCASIGIVACKEESRFYPRSKEAASFASALYSAAEKEGAVLINNFLAKLVQKNEQGFIVESESGDKLSSDNLVIATGGKAGIQYGCYGDGFKWAKDFGLEVKKPIPALCGLTTKEELSLLHGVRVDARVSLYKNEELVASDDGEVQFTKDGISGICVMNLSRFVRYENEEKYTLSIDMYKELSKEALLNLFKEQIEKRGCAMDGLVPEKMHDYLHTRIEPGMHNPMVMAGLSKDLRFEITGSLGWKNAQVTSGGVELGQLDGNYQAKKVPGLFFAGEVIDYDGPCGGYNINWAIKTGLDIGEYFSK